MSVAGRVFFQCFVNLSLDSSSRSFCLPACGFTSSTFSSHINNRKPQSRVAPEECCRTFIRVGLVRGNYYFIIAILTVRK